MKEKSLITLIIEALEDVKAQDIIVYDTQKKTSDFNQVVICSGTSNRQTRALASSVMKTVKAAGHGVNGIEGTDSGEWVLIDCGSVVVHCMQPNIRQYYNLEELWGPDALDLEALKKSLPEEAPKPTAKKKTVRKTTAKKTTVKKTAAKKAVVKKTTVKKTTKKVAAKTTAKA